MSVSCDETYDAYTETERKARKPHVCDACEEPIPPKHRYFFISWVFDGAADSVKRCLRCQAIHLHLRELGRKDEMWPSETLNCGEEYTDHWGKEPPAHIAEMAFWSPEDKQALCFRVFRNKRGDHFIARSLVEATELYGGPASDLSAVPGDASIPIVIDGAERFYHYPYDYGPKPTEMYELGLKELHLPYEYRSALEWAVEYGIGRLCSGEPVPPLQGPWEKRNRAGRFWA